MIDSKLRPWLLEVNHSPSFTTDAELDYDLKLALITDTIKMLNLSTSRKSKYKRTRQKEVNDRMMGKNKPANKEKSSVSLKIKNAEKKRIKYESKNHGGYELLYPTENADDMERYKGYAKEALAIWEKFTGSYKPKDKEMNNSKLNNTPKIKTNTKASTTSITTSTRGSKKGSVRLSLGRTLQSREKNGKVVKKRIKKTYSEKIGIE